MSRTNDAHGLLQSSRFTGLPLATQSKVAAVLQNGSGARVAGMAGVPLRH